MARERPFQDSRLEFDDERTDAFWEGRRLELTPESYMVLQLLARAPDTVHTPDEIAEYPLAPIPAVQKAQSCKN